MNYLLVEIPMAFMAMAVGFVSAIWYMKYKESHLPADAEFVEADEKQKAAIETERANMAALQIRDLAKNVASDVGAHNTLVTEISHDLDALKGESQAAVTDAVAKILAANEKLQDRLADAEHKIQAKAEELRAQESEARTDSLTNIANRRAFDDAMEKNLSGFVGNRSPFSLMIFDVDHFKQFNDTHGHQAGDEVLRQVANTLTNTVKSSDLPCRYGGEEFAVVMANTKIDSARIAAERVRKSIEEMDVEFEGKTLNVTASIGVAEVFAQEDSSLLIKRADDSVYAAKKAGRNRSYWNNGNECIPVIGGEKQETVAESVDTLPEEAQQKSSATVDDLPNRSAFTNELNRRISESQRFGVSLSIMQLRVKNYDHLASEYGDAVGHLLLDSVAQFIRAALREMDLLGKLKGGDFIAMLPGSSEKEAKMVGDRVQEAISNCVIPLGNNKLKLGLEVGITDVYPTDDPESMMARVFRLVDNNAALPVG